jgi:hypothetical protein
MTHVYFHCSNRNELLVDRCGAVVDDLAEARDHAACVVRSLTTARSLEDWRGWILHVNDDRSSSPFLSCLASRMEGRAVRDRLQEATKRFSKSLSHSSGTRCAVCDGGFGPMQLEMKSNDHERAQR